MYSDPDRMLLVAPVAVANVTRTLFCLLNGPDVTRSPLFVEIRIYIRVLVRLPASRSRAYKLYSLPELYDSRPWANSTA
jgi:hypothetical protein